MANINSVSQKSLQNILSSIGVKSSDPKNVAKNKSSLGQEDFLKLMTTQLQNQDPFAPMENGEFISQMAQFSTVTGIAEVAKSMKELTNQVSEFRIATAAQFLGHQVLIPGSKATPDSNGEIHGAVDLPYGTTELTIGFKRPNGEVIHTESLGSQQAGLVGFGWVDIPEEIQEKIKENKENIIVAAYTAEGGSQSRPATAVYSKILGAAAGEQGVELEVANYGLINASEALRFRN